MYDNATGLRIKYYDSQYKWKNGNSPDMCYKLQLLSPILQHHTIQIWTSMLLN